MMKKNIWFGTLGMLFPCFLLFSGCIEEKNKSTESATYNVVTAFIQQANNPAYIWKGWAAQRLMEDTGLSLEFAATGTQVEDKLKLYMTSGTIPDLIGFKDLNQAKIYMNADLLLPLNEQETLLPALFQENYKNAVWYSEAYLSNGTGNLFLMPVSIGTVKGDDLKSIPMLQWTTFRRCGMPEIQTLEDYLDVVEMMLNEKPLSNSGEVMYGFSLYRNNGGIAEQVAALAYTYGIDMYSITSLMETDMNTNKIESVLREDSFLKRVLHFYFEANRRGLLDADSRNQTYNNLERKISSGRVMMTLNQQIAEKYNENQMSYGNSRKLEDGYAALSAKDMKFYQESERVVGKNMYFAIYKNSPRLEKVCKLLNWLYEEDTQFYLYNGPQGIIWDYDASGIPYITEEGRQILADGTSELPEYQGALEDGVAPFKELGLSQASLTEDGYALSYQYWENESNAPWELNQELIDLYGADSFQEYLEKNNMTVQADGGVYMVEAISTNLHRKHNDVQELIESYSWNLIFAKDENEFEMLWQEMKQQAYELGMEEIEEFYETAWLKAMELSKQYTEE